MSKVYGIVGTQLMVTALLCLIPFLSPESTAFRNQGVLIASFVVALVTMCLLTCVRKIARSVPTNYILLFIFTISMSYGVACTCSMYEPEIVLQAAFMTAALVIGLTFYAMTTKTDFTFLANFMVSLAVSMIAFIILGMCMAFRMTLLYCLLGTVLFSIYLIIDTQLICGKHGLSTEDYIIGAMILYLDILNIFLFILRLLGRK